MLAMPDILARPARDMQPLDQIFLLCMLLLAFASLSCRTAAVRHCPTSTGHLLYGILFHKPVVCATQVDSEMNILRGERDQAKDIIDDLQKKLSAVQAVLADHDAERQVGGQGSSFCNPGHATKQLWQSSAA